MNKTAVRASALSALAIPAILIGAAAGAGTASAAPSVTAKANADRTITITPTADEQGLRECEFKIKNEADKSVAKKEYDYRKGDPIEAVTFGPFDPGTYTVESECKDDDKNKYKEKIEVKIGSTSSDGSNDSGPSGSLGSLDIGLIGLLEGLLPS